MHLIQCSKVHNIIDMDDELYSIGFKEGMKRAFAANGLSTNKGIRMISKQAALTSSKVMQRKLIEMASSIFKEAGYQEDSAFCDNLQRTDNPELEFVKKAVASAVLNVLGEEKVQEEERMMDKQAGWLTKLLAGITALPSDTLKLMALSSIAVGGAGGAAYWYLNRDSNLEDAETMVKLEQAKHYRQLAEKLRSRANKDMSNYAIANTAADVINESSYGSLSSGADKRPVYA